MNFDIVCGNCFKAILIPSSDGGSLLSCGDFLCKDCASNKFSTVGCPVCGRTDVRAVFLNDALPIEVKRNLNDPTKEFQSLYGAISFQIRYYKEVIKRLISKNQQLQLENNNQKAQIKNLESTIQQKQAAPSFFSKDPDQRSDIFESTVSIFVDQDIFKSSRREAANIFLPPNVQPTTHQREPRPPGVYYKQVAYPESRDYVPVVPSQKSPVRLYADKKHREESVNRGMNVEPVETERRRIYTPSRTIFSAQSNQSGVQNIGGTPSRIRSPYNQIIRSPSSAYAFIPETSNPPRNVYQTLARSPKESMHRRESQSPITSYIRQTYK